MANYWNPDSKHTNLILYIYYFCLHKLQQLVIIFENLIDSGYGRVCKAADIA